MAVAVLLSACLSPPAFGAEPKFVGVLALAVDEAVAKELELTEGQKEKLLKLIESREDGQELTELVLTLKDLDPAQQEERLAQFRRQSESLGLALLTPEQGARLQQIRIRQTGLAALAEPQIAKGLTLSDEQRGRVAAILKERDEGLRGADQNRMHVIRAETERKLAAILSEQQRAKWQGLTGGPKGRPPSTGPGEVGVAGPPDPTDVFEGKPPEPTDPPPVEPPEEAAVEPGDETPPEPGDEGPPEPAEGAPDEPAVRPAGTPGMLRFNFKAHPWAEVLEWFAEKADLSYVPDDAPQGTFNYIDNKEYTPAQAIDLLNRVLLIKGYVLVTHERMLFLVNIEDGVPDYLVSEIQLEDLDDRGESELVSVVFSLDKITPEQAQQEIEGLVGPLGKIVPLPLSRQIKVIETGGRLRRIRDVIQRIEGPDGLLGDRMQTFVLEHITPDEAMAVMRPLLDIDEEDFSSDDGSIRVGVDQVGNRLLATGKPDKVARVKEILDAIDVGETVEPGAGTVDDELILMVYPITGDPESVLAVLQTLLAGEPDVRLARDPKTGSLVALARRSLHETIIQPTLEKYGVSERLTEVIHLRVVDPTYAVLAINKLFGAGGEDGDPTAPQVDADPTSRILLVRGTASQIEQIRTLLEKMGETDTTQPAVAAGGGSVRMIPLNSRTRMALEQLQEFWPAVRPNRLRVVTPSAAIPRMRSGGPAGAPEPGAAEPDATPGLPEQPPREPAAAENPPAPNKAAGLRGGARLFLVAQPVEIEPKPAEPESEPDEPAPQPDDAAPSPSDAPPGPAEVDPIVVTVTRGAVIIASRDTEALDVFEEWLTTLAGGTGNEAAYPTVFFLKYAKATVVAETLDQIFGGGTLVESGGGGSMVGDLANAAIGGTAGGIIGAMLGGGGGTITPSGTVRITPEPRLNALFVQAGPADVDLIEQLLQILDDEEPEDVLAKPQTRIIPVYNTQADRIAEMIRELFRNNLATSGSSGGSSRPSPEQIMQMLRGGRGGSSGRGGQRRAAEEVQKMTISVDTLTNSVVVAAPEPLLTQVEQTVRELDLRAVESANYTIVTKRLHNTSPTVVQGALSAMLGQSVQFGGSTGSSTRSRTSSRSSTSTSSDDARRAFFMEMMRRRMEMGGGPPGRGGPPGGMGGGRGGPGSTGGGRGGPGSTGGGRGRGR
jgi:type II secretory pathway component GspD/PulD (secretin)